MIFVPWAQTSWIFRIYKKETYPNIVNQSGIAKFSSGQLWPSPFSFDNMITCGKKLTSVNSVFTGMESILAKTSQNKMTILTLLLILLLSGLTLAYFMSCFPAILISIFEGKHQLASSDVLTSPGTSVVKRSRQQSVPTNSGYPHIYILSIIKPMTSVAQLF